MQFKALAISALVASVTAADITSLVAQVPDCALTCLITGASTVGCGVTDYDCQCKNAAALQAASGPCVQSSCDTADTATALSLSSQICVSLGYSAVSSMAASATSAAGTAAASAVSSIASVVSSATKTGTATSTSSSATSTSTSTSGAVGRVEIGAMAGVAAVFAYAL